MCFPYMTRRRNQEVQEKPAEQHDRTAERKPAPTREVSTIFIYHHLMITAKHTLTSMKEKSTRYMNVQNDQL